MGGVVLRNAWLIVYMLSILAFAGTPDTIRVLVSTDARFELSGILLAQQEGYYAESDLEVQLVAVPPSRDLVTMLQAHHGDFAIAEPGFLVEYARGVPLVSLLPLYQHSPYVLVAQPGIANLRDLVGQWVGLPADMRNPVNQMLARMHVPRDSLLVLGQNGYYHESFRAASLAAVALHSGHDSWWLQNYEVPYTVFDPARNGVDSYGACLIGLDKQMDTYLERTGKFLAATRQGYQQAITHPNQAIEILQLHYPGRYTRDDLQYEAGLFQKNNGNSFGEQNIRRWTEMLQVMQGAGLIRTTVDIEDLVVTSLELQQSSEQHQRRFWLFVAIGTFTLVLLLFAFNMRLRRAVRRQTSDLRASQNRLELALHSASDGVWERPDSRFEPLWFSPRIYELLGIEPMGYSPTYTAFSAFVHRDDLVQLRIAQGTATGANNRFDVELRLDTVRGWRWFRMRGALQDNRQGGFRVSAILQDINDSRLAHEALRRNESRLRQYFEVGLVGMAMLDVHGKVLHVNSVLARWLGIGERECIGKNWEEFTFAEDIALEQMLFIELREGKRDNYRLDKRLVRQPGGQIWHAMAAMRRIDADGIRGGGGFVMTVLDISEKQRARAEQERLLAVLALKNRTLETTLNAIGHDLSEPLTRLSGRLSELRKAAPECEATVMAMNRETDTLASMLKAMVKLSRLGVLAEQRNVDVTGMVQSVAHEFSPRLAECHGELCVFQLPPCRGDEMQLYQVFSNLLDNALRFREPTRNLSVVVQGEVRGEMVEYRMRDNGIGVSPRNLTQLSTLFFATRAPSDASLGLGVGLAIVSRIVENHGGNVRYLSEQNRWTEVVVSLPVA